MIGRLQARSVGPVIFAVVVAIAAAAAHAGVWYYISRRLGLSSAVAAALITLAVIKHLGWIGGGFVLFRRRRTPSK